MNLVQSLKRFQRLAILLSVVLIPASLLALPISFTINNNTNESLGNVTLNQTSGSTTISVSSPGAWLTSIESGVNSVTVAGQTVAYPNQGSIVLPSGHAGRVTWVSTSYVEILDLQMGS